MTCTHYNFPVPEEKMVRVITDTDLCNEADDPFAVVQALLSPKFDNVGMVAAHFGTRDPNGMQKSWQGLKDLTVLMQLTVPVLHGAPHALPDAATPVPSEGAKLIIREAMKEDTRLFAGTPHCGPADRNLDRRRTVPCGRAGVQPGQ